MRSARLGTKYVTPLMKKQRSGSIINCASIAGMGVGYGPTLYSIGKAAVISLTKSVAIEWAGSGTPEDIAYAAVYLASDERWRFVRNNRIDMEVTRVKRTGAALLRPHW